MVRRGAALKKMGAPKMTNSSRRGIHPSMRMGKAKVKEYKNGKQL